MKRAPRVFCLMGPTASGKTALALKLAQHHPIDIVSVDSALVYKGMDIGSGKPSATELKKTPHHLIDICDPAVPYSVGKFREDALKAIDGILAANRIPLLVGGTMMYFKALLEGLALLPPADSEIRQSLDNQAKRLGWPLMHEKLKQIDPKIAQKIKPMDAQRIQRALEVYEVSNRPLSAWLALQSESIPPYDFQSIGFIPTDEQRLILHKRIEKRFLNMLEAGLIPEVERLFQRSDLNLNTPSIRCVGYRQVWEYLLGQYNEEIMKQKAIAATRQLAKRQITWLRSWPALIQMDFFDEEATLSHCHALFKRDKHG